MQIFSSRRNKGSFTSYDGSMASRSDILSTDALADWPTSNKSNLQGIQNNRVYEDSGNHEPDQTERLTFFDSSLAKERKTYFRTICLGALLTSIAILLVLSICWGSLWRMGQYISHLEGLVIDYDQKTIGSAVKQAFSQATGSPGQVTWIVADSQNFPNPDRLSQMVLDEKYWVVVVVTSGATNNLRMAISSANSTYNPQEIVTIYCSESRNENTYSEFLLPQITDAMRSASRIFNPDHLRLLSMLPSDHLTTLLRKSPTIVYQPLDFQVLNLRPFDVPVAAAVNLIGLIYLLIFSFIVTLLNYNAQRSSGLYEKLSLSSLILLRISMPFLMYLWLCLAYCLVSLAYQVPFDRFIRGGFMVYWSMSFVTMCALGLTLEAVITLLTPRFIPYFMVLWVILNVSVSLFPIPLLPRLFRYGYAFPFYNVSRTVRALVFNTRNEIGLNFLVQFMWILLALISIVVFQFCSTKSHLQRLGIRSRISHLLRIGACKKKLPTIENKL